MNAPIASLSWSASLDVFVFILRILFLAMICYSLCSLALESSPLWTGIKLPMQVDEQSTPYSISWCHQPTHDHSDSLQNVPILRLLHASGETRELGSRMRLICRRLIQLRWQRHVDHAALNESRGEISQQRPYWNQGYWGLRASSMMLSDSIILKQSKLPKGTRLQCHGVWLYFDS